MGIQTQRFLFYQSQTILLIKNPNPSKNWWLFFLSFPVSLRGKGITNKPAEMVKLT